MPKIFVEDHAIDRYIERVRDCPREEVRSYLTGSAPTGARMRERTHAGNEQIRLWDCVLVMGPHKDGEAVITVLGPGEVESLAAGGEEDEQATLNRLADASRHAKQTKVPKTLSPPRGAEPPDDYVPPKTREECEQRRAQSLLAAQEIEGLLQRTPPGDARGGLTDDLIRTHRRLGKLRDWLKADNKRLDAEKQAAKKIANVAPPVTEEFPQAVIGMTASKKKQAAISLKKAAKTKEEKHKAHIAVLEERIAALRDRHEAHCKTMEVEKRKPREALRIAVKHLVEIKAEEALEEIAAIEPGYLTPEFYDLKSTCHRRAKRSS